MLRNLKLPIKEKSILYQCFFVIQVLDLTKGVGHRQFRSEAVNEKQENYSQLTSSELEKRDQQVAGVDRELAPHILNISKEEQEDKKLLEEVDREAIDNNLITMVNEW